MTRKYNIVATNNPTILNRIYDVTKLATMGKLYRLDGHFYKEDGGKLTKLQNPNKSTAWGDDAIAKRLFNKGCLKLDYNKTMQTSNSIAVSTVVSDVFLKHGMKQVLDKIAQNTVKSATDEAKASGQAVAASEPYLIITTQDGFVTNIAISGDVKVRIVREE